MLRAIVLMVHGAAVALSSMALGFLWQALLDDWSSSLPKTLGLSALTTGLLLVAIFRTAALLKSPEESLLDSYPHQSARRYASDRHGCSCCGQVSPHYREAELTLAAPRSADEPPPPAGLTIIEETFFLKLCDDCYRAVRGLGPEEDPETLGQERYDGH